MGRSGGSSIRSGWSNNGEGGAQIGIRSIIDGW